MFIRQLLGVVLRLEFFFEHLRENVLELTVVRFQNRVFRAQVHREIALQAKGETRAREIANRIVVVVHAHCDAAIGTILGHFKLQRCAAIGRRVRHRERTRSLHLEVRRLVLIGVRVATNHNWLGPTRHQLRNVRHDDRLAENHTAKDVANGAVRTLPHFLESEFLHACFVRCNGRALYRRTVPLRGLGRINRDLITRRITMFHAQVVVIQLNVEIRQDELVLDELPDDARHLVAIHLHYRIYNLDLGHEASCECDLVGMAPRIRTTIPNRVSRSKFVAALKKRRELMSHILRAGHGSSSAHVKSVRCTPCGGRSAFSKLHTHSQYTGDSPFSQGSIACCDATPFATHAFCA